jgi:hypothetical protein
MFVCGAKPRKLKIHSHSDRKNVDATVWAGTDKKQFGIRVGVQNRALYFSQAWRDVVVEMDGQLYHFDLSPGFWQDCPEFRDGREASIKAWLGRHALLDWPKGRPPTLMLDPVGGNRFRLLKR